MGDGTSGGIRRPRATKEETQKGWPLWTAGTPGLCANEHGWALFADAAAAECGCTNYSDVVESIGSTAGAESGEWPATREH